MPEHADLERAFEQIRAAAHTDHERWKTTETDYLRGKVDGLDYAALIVGRLIDQRPPRTRKHLDAMRAEDERLGLKYADDRPSDSQYEQQPYLNVSSLSVEYGHPQAAQSDGDVP